MIDFEQVLCAFDAFQDRRKKFHRYELNFQINILRNDRIEFVHHVHRNGQMDENVRQTGRIGDVLINVRPSVGGFLLFENFAENRQCFQQMFRTRTERILSDQMKKKISKGEDVKRREMMDQLAEHWIGISRRTTTTMKKRRGEGRSDLFDVPRWTSKDWIP